MSALGQKQTLDWRPMMSALTPKADIDPNQSPCASKRDTRPSVQPVEKAERGFDERNYGSLFAELRELRDVQSDPARFLSVLP